LDPLGEVFLIPPVHGEEIAQGLGVFVIEPVPPPTVIDVREEAGPGVERL
jgi:hypothetical protein